MRKSKADGYAPRCLVAEATAAQVQYRAHDGGTLPAKVRVGGARWGVGAYRCTYEAKTGYTQAQCVHTGKRRQHRALPPRAVGGASTP